MPCGCLHCFARRPLVRGPQSPAPDHPPKRTSISDQTQSNTASKRARKSPTPPPSFPGPFLNEEITRDLLDNRSNFRKHELVWCQIDDLKLSHESRMSGHELDLGIRFWPGLCESIVLCSQSQAFCVIEDDPDPDPKTSDYSSGYSNLPRPALSKRKSARPKQLADTNRLFRKEIQNQQKFQWNIRLLALSDVVLREESHILPWLFKPIDIKKKFATRIREGALLPKYLHDQHQSTRPGLNTFTSREEALVSFQLALQIAANLEEFWEAHDRYYLPPEDSVSQPLELAGPDKASGELFQALWWGAERIWLHDLVRLNKLATDTLSCTGSPEIKYDDPVLDRSAEKGYFLKIDGIYRHGAGPKLVIMGRLFDLIRADRTQANSDKSRSKTSRSVYQHMPDPPPGYQFRQVAPTDRKVHVYVDCLSGRYYSPTPKNHANRLGEIGRRLAPRILQDLSIEGASPLAKSNELIWTNASLLGYTSGHRNFMRCRKWKPNRVNSIMKAEALAEKEMIIAFENAKKSFSHPTVITIDP